MINNKYHLVVSGLSGTVYIAKLLKQRGVMSSDRIEVDETEFLLAVEQYAKARIKEGYNVLEVKNQEGELKFDIKIYKQDLVSKAKGAK